MDADTRAILGGSLAGGVILALLMGLCIYFSCKKKKKDKKRRDLKKFRPYLQPSPAQSHRHSNQVRAQQLPKVNSTGLWIGAPSLYSTGPSPAYYYGRPGGPPPRAGLIPRAASEQRIPPPSPAHNQRIYHSQQLAPVYELPPSTGMEIYDVYQFPGAQSRSKMLETKHTQQFYTGGLAGHRVERSKSDAQDRKKNANNKNKLNDKKTKAPTSNSKESSLRSNVSNRPGGPLTVNQGLGDSLRSSLIGSSHGKPRPLESPRHAQRLASSSHSNLVNGVHVNRAYSPDTGEIIRASGPSLIRSRSSATSSPRAKPHQAVDNNSTSGGRDLTSSATDSMKLLAKNKTDDQKTSIPIIVAKDTHEEENGPKHYIYNEDVYAVSSRARASLRDENNPIITRMKEMVIEKSRSTDLSPRNKAVVKPNDSFVDSESPYAEISSTFTGGEKETLKVRDVIVARDPSPILSPALSSDGEGGSEDLSKAGKRITESAFTFLDTYLSDDEGTDTQTDTHRDSPPPALTAQAVAD